MSKQDCFKSYDILGVEIDAITTQQAINYITDLAQNPGPAVYVTKPYVEFMDLARRDPKIRAILNDSTLCLSDGVALNWAAYYLTGQHSLPRLLATLLDIVFNPKKVFSLLPERIGGINFTWPLLQQCQKLGLKVFLVGTPRAQTIEYTVDVVRHRLPGINIVGSTQGDTTRVDEMLAKIMQAGADIVLVGVGFPAQERLMAQLAPKLIRGVLIGEGGSFDYQQFGGSIRRAPRLVQAVNLEWLWRLMRQPSRIWRQMAIPRFIYYVYQEGKKS